MDPKTLPAMISTIMVTAVRTSTKRVRFSPFSFIVAK